MKIDAPMQFTEAVQIRRLKKLMPTSLDSFDLETQIPAAIRERAMFSAQQTDATFLGMAADLIDAIVSGEGHADPVTGARPFPAPPGQMIDRPLAVLKLRNYLDAIGHIADPAVKGTIADISSARRLALIIDMGVLQAHGFGQWRSDQDETVLDLYPCSELVRVSPRVEPRGEIAGAPQFATISQSEAFGGDEWPRRWHEAGGLFYGPTARMIAPKNDPIWAAISRFGVPYPPFDYQSGIGVKDVDREEAERLGVITPGQQIAPQQRDFATDLKGVDLSSLPADIRAIFEGSAQ